MNKYNNTIKFTPADAEYITALTQHPTLEKGVITAKISRKEQEIVHNTAAKWTAKVIYELTGYGFAKQIEEEVFKTYEANTLNPKIKNLEQAAILLEGFRQNNINKYKGEDARIATFMTDLGTIKTLEVAYRITGNEVFKRIQELYMPSKKNK